MKHIERFGGSERSFRADEIIVSKTDPSGRILYCNDVFLRVSGYAERELLGQPHKILRHPAMPKAIFKLWWDHLRDGRECFAYVVNRCRNGDWYWVSAHGTPSYDKQGTISGFHSNRRVPEPRILRETIVPLYAELLDIEQRAGDGRSGMNDAHTHFTDLLARKGLSYDQWFFAL